MKPDAHLIVKFVKPMSFWIFHLNNVVYTKIDKMSILLVSFYAICTLFGLQIETIWLISDDIVSFLILTFILASAIL